ncbi:12091_t:CDS:10 [Racocetra fulgida]|uniref:Spindle assembly checkpoint component MAD1 n=1 Tax=Racocetra fulgida TaxID=60492 RepID=A0A9N8VPE1_9GLOM|nr:12091_t:CDS:10 [Racocetra fulgida]
MAYPPYKRSAEKKSGQYVFDNDANPFMRSSSSSTSVPPLFQDSRLGKLSEARAKIAELEHAKNDLDRKITRLETEKQSSELQVKELNLKNEQTSVREATRLQNEINKLAQNLQEIRNISQSKESESNRTINTLQSELTRLNHHILQQNEISTSRQAILSQVQEQLIEAEQKLQEFNQLSSQLDDFKHLKKQSQEQSLYIQNLEKSNNDLKNELERLKELSPSIQILQQKVESSEYQLSLMRSLRRQAAELEAENAAASYLDQEKDKININSPYKLCKELASRRIEINMLEEKVGRLEEQIKSRDMIISENEYKKSYDKEEQHLQTNYDEQKIERIQVLENLLTTYKEELEQISAQSHNNQQLEDQSGPSEINPHTVEVLRRNEELQAIIYDLKNENVNLKKEVTSLQMQITVLEQKDLKIHSSELIKQNEILQETINDLKNENLSLRKHASSLDQQVFALEKAVGRGEYNQETTRVLELKDNPSSRDYAIRQSTLDALKTENNQLLTKLKELQKMLENNHTTQVETMDDNDNSIINVIPTQSFTNLENENKQLVEQIAEKEKRILRLKEVWKTKAQEYREAVYSLLGYRFDFLENGRVRLTSMYSEQDDQSFIFTSDENDCGTMQLVGGNSEFIKSLDHLIKFWVVERSSIPCFLSSLTMKLFENTTSGPVGRDMDMSICSTVNQESTTE